MTTKYLYYKDFPEVLDLITEVRNSIADSNKIVKNYNALYGLPPELDFEFNKDGLNITYKKTKNFSSNRCNGVVVELDYQSFNDPKSFGLMVQELTSGKFSAIYFPNSKMIVSKEFDFGESSLKIRFCNPKSSML
jgi:hypothetical protein